MAATIVHAHSSADDVRNEEEFLAYLAIVAQSVVMDSFRREKALKRPIEQRICVPGKLDFVRAESVNGAREKVPAAERHVLAEEVRRIGLLSIKNLSGSSHAMNSFLLRPAAFCPSAPFSSAPSPPVASQTRSHPGQDLTVKARGE